SHCPAGRERVRTVLVEEARTVLVVDDDPDLRRMIGRLLEHEGFDVRLAEDGQAALGHLEPMPDVIVADLMMPQLDGEGFLLELGRRYPDASPQVVLLSASAIRDDVARRLGVVASLDKPFDTVALVDLVRELFELAESADDGDGDDREG
ncbi:MAG TPA: response regulator, partial [Polyangiaceae bacterium LLY-WYZ-15_(1-7)]|nr:response regulator [Polyangiaceae bacterium LLY-WYZ-15_(1-7)]